MDSELKELLAKEMLEMFNDGYKKGAISAIEMVKNYILNVTEIDKDDFDKVCDYFITTIKYTK